MTRIGKVICAAALVCGLTMPAVAVGPAVPDLTGNHWQHSAKNEKLAFLYGASSIVVIDQLIAQRQGVEPSRFVAAWMKAFGDSSLTQVQERLDAWYAGHPEQVDRGVFDVLWHEFMAPAGEPDSRKTGATQ